MTVKRKKSRVTQPTGVHDKKLIAVRIPAFLRRQLDVYENRSEIIIEIIEEYFSNHKDCPRCNGTGKVKK